MAGRHCKLTPEVADTIVEAIRQGVPSGQAAALADVGASTLHTWLRQGEEEEEGDFRAFRDRYYRARADLCKKAVGVQVVQLDHEDPRISGAASRFLLAHAFSSDFRTRTESTGPEGAPVAVQLSGHVSTSAIPAEVLAHMSPDQLRALAEGLEVPDGTEGEP